MKPSILLPILGLITAVAVSAALYLQVRELRQETRDLRQGLAQATKPAPEEAIELSDIMEKLQRHSTKLYVSGRHQNWPLAAFYLEEIEETVKDVASHHVMEGQINISGLMPALILPEIEKLEEAVKRQDTIAFKRDYQALTASCNACHTTANHGFIVIQEPEMAGADNQRYDVLHAAAGN